MTTLPDGPESPDESQLARLLSGYDEALVEGRLDDWSAWVAAVPPEARRVWEKARAVVELLHRFRRRPGRSG